VALGSRLWAVTAGGLFWLLCMEACCCAEQQRQQAEDRRDSMQCFLHLIPLDVSICEVDALFGNFFFLSLKTGESQFVHSILFAGKKGALWQR
jgi:hypothetical protein